MSMESGRKLKVKDWRDIQPRDVHGMMIRQLFTAREGGFESSFNFALYNTLAPGASNERHNHEDVEKVYFVIQGEATVHCGKDEAKVHAGNAFFLPVQIEHSITNTGKVELHLVVFASRVLNEGA